MRCLICIGHFPHECPVISGSFVKNDLRLKASYGSSPPYIKEFIAMIKCMYICIPMSHIPNVCIYTFQMYVYIHSNVTHSNGNWIHWNASNFLECKCVKFSGENNISTVDIGMYTYIHLECVTLEFIYTHIWSLQWILWHRVTKTHRIPSVADHVSQKNYWS